MKTVDWASGPFSGEEIWSLGRSLVTYHNGVIPEQKMENTRSLWEVFDNFSLESRELYLLEEIPRIAGPPSPLSFYREFVASNSPVLIENAFGHWPAVRKWSPSYLLEKLGNLEITVAVTPNGYADAVVGDRFVMPEERTMKFAEFLDILEGKSSKEKGIFYIQKQNSNFTEEFRELLSEADTDIPWATEAFGVTPDAVNFWMGDERAVTSLHKDHYENLYCVISGCKTFTLIPPTDLPNIPYGDYKPSKYKSNSSGEFEIVDIFENGSENTAELVPWISIDPLKPDLDKYPRFGKAKIISCTVNAGEMLYLPSLWFHHVQQSHGCIALNFWYDMQFDIKYCYFKFLENISKVLNKNGIKAD